MNLKTDRTTTATAAPKSKNWLLLKFRQWHGWGGIIAAVFLLVAGSTGIVLNYKKPILGALGLEKSPNEMTSKNEKEHKGLKKIKGGKKTLLHADIIGSLPVSFEHALALAKKQFGGAPLEKIELKDEHGWLVYKIKQPEGDELWIDASTGDFLVKAEYEKAEMAGTTGQAAKTFDWGKFFLDLHTGKIGGEAGKAVMTGVAGILLLLTFSGIYLWTVPIWRKRQTAKIPALAVTERKSPARSAAARPEETVGA